MLLPVHPYYEADGNALYDRENLTLIYYLKSSNVAAYEVKADTCAIGAGAFARVKRLEQVTLSDGVFEIGARAFEECYALETLPNMTNALITDIPSRCFNGCASLTEVTIPENITAIRSMAFANCSALSSVNIPATVTSIADDAFAGCAPTIYGESGSVAEAWANRHGYLFDAGDMVYPESLALDSSELFLKRGDRRTLVASLLPEGAFNVIHWVSLDPDIATVTSAGVVHAIAGGDTTVYAVTVNGIFASCDVHVEHAVLPERIELKTAYRNINPGETAEMTVRVLPEYATDKAVLFQSSDESVATIDQNGVLTAHSVGDVTITAIARADESVYATCDLRVYAYIEQIILEPYYHVWEDETTWLTAVVLPEDADATAIKWGGSVVVSYEGEAMPWKRGSSSIISVPVTCQATDGSGVSASSTLAIWNHVKTVTLSKEHLEMRIGDTWDLRNNRSILPNNAHVPSWNWVSSDESVVSVEEDGLVTAVGPGTAYVTCAVVDPVGAVSNACEFLVYPDLDIIQFDTPDHIDLYMTKSANVNAILPPAYSDVPEPLVWENSDEGVVSMNAGGTSCYLTPVGPGTAIITARLTDGSGEPASVEVYVSPVIEKINLESLVYARNLPFNVNMTLEPEGAIADSITWTTSSPLSLYYSQANGGFIGKSTGRYAITATANDGGGAKASCIVEIKYGVETITLSPTSLRLWVGEGTAFLGATVTPSQAYKRLSWTSSNPDVAMVDDTGSVQAVGCGNAIITAEAMDGTGIFAQCPVEVYSFEIVAPCLSGQPGEKIELRGVTVPEHPGDTLVWVSDDPEVASVDADGVVTLIRPGIATITATAESMEYADSVNIECLGGHVVKLPDAVTTVSEESFAGSGCEIVEFGPNVESISDRAFADCPQLYKIIVHGTDTCIGPDAFEGCGKLSVYAPEGSSAQNWAELHDCRFQAIDGE